MSTLAQFQPAKDANVVPVHAKMEMEVRGENDEINRYMQQTAERMIKGSAESYGVQYKIDIMGMATDIHSDDSLSDMLKEEANKYRQSRKFLTSPHVPEAKIALC